MKKQLLILALFSSLIVNAQQVQELNYGEIRYPWKTFYKHSGFWITHPSIDTKQYNVVLFRKTFDLETIPSSLVIHISADNLYRLFINGKYICMGPARNDLFHWNYETIDIAPFLQKGKNIIAAQVNNFGHNKAMAQFSFNTGLVISAADTNFAFVNTDDFSWKTIINKAVNERPVQWMYGIDILNGWYCINPNDSIVGSQYPWGWQKNSFDDSKWQTPRWMASVCIRYTGQHGPTLMEPRSVKLLRHQVERIESIARTENITIKTMPFNGKDSLVIPANSTVSILLDHKKETMGFPELIVSKGKGSKVKVIYSECLWDANKMKGNRNDLKNKKIIGVYDVILPGGGHAQNYQPLWYRAFRFIQLDIKTGSEPLVINDFYNNYTSYPFEEKAAFMVDDPMYKQIWNAGVRTDYICSQDFYMSDAYYETMQYFADTRVHGIVTAALSGDYSLYKQAIKQFDQSRIPDGLTLAAYPNDWYWVLPYFSLMWVDMVHDYTMLTNDQVLAKEMIPGVRCVLDWFERHVQESGLLGELEWANPNGSNKNSTLFTLYYAYSLKNTAKVCDLIGLPQEASLYRNRADRMARAVYAQSWDSKRNMLAETPEKKSYSQWGNLMGILTDAIPADKQEDLMKRICKDTTIAHVGYFESFYLFEALKKTGLAELFDQELKPWKDQMNEGLTTFKEIPSDKARSDCHPWSTSPLYYYLNIMAGIETVTPGFKQIKIAPYLGNSKSMKASMPTVSGMITLDLKKVGKSGIKGTVQIPDQSKGNFVWNGTTIPLNGGLQQIDMK